MIRMICKMIFSLKFRFPTKIWEKKNFFKITKNDVCSEKNQNKKEPLTETNVHVAEQFKLVEENAMSNEIPSQLL